MRPCQICVYISWAVLFRLDAWLGSLLYEEPYDATAVRTSAYTWCVLVALSLKRRTTACDLVTVSVVWRLTPRTRHPEAGLRLALGASKLPDRVSFT